MLFIATLGATCLSGYLTSVIINASKLGVQIISDYGSAREDWIIVRDRKIDELQKTVQRIQQKDVRGLSLSSHSDLPSKWTNAIAQAPYEIEDALICPTNAAQNTKINNILDELQGLLRCVELEYERSKAQDSQPNCEQASKGKCTTSTSLFEARALELEASRVTPKDAVIEELNSSSSIGIAIIGIGGLGKKSLAFAVADDPNIKDTFHLHVVDLDTDLLAARESLPGNKKLLILLDRMVPMDLEEWDRFRSYLIHLNPESKVLITTDDPRVADAANCTKYLLPNLTGKECISIIRKTCDRSVTDKLAKTEIDKLINQYERDLADKCKGLCLLAYHIGLLLSAEKNDLPGTMTRITSTGGLWEEAELKTALLNLRPVSLVLKDLTLWRCVSYCSLFPQGHDFKKEDLVQLWMAEGFFPAPQTEKEYVTLLGKKTTEGFDKLLSCSILTPGKGQTYAMHELIYDFAQYVGSKTVYRMCIGASESAPPSNLLKDSPAIRHLSVSCEKSESSETNINRVREFLSYIPKNWKSLRTLLLVGKEFKQMINDKTSFFEALNRLRVLDLSGTKLTKISSNKMKQLRFLDLSDTLITALPSLSTNLELQVLKLNNCDKLKSLPENLINLTNLVSLQLNTRGLKKPLAGIGKLKYLKYLDQFISLFFPQFLTIACHRYVK